MTEREYSLLLQMVQAVNQPPLTEAEYRAAVERGQVAPCEAVMQLASADYAKGWESCRERVIRYVEELLAPRRDELRLREAARVPPKPPQR